MPSPQVPKYQAIYAVLREQILGGELEAGSRLPPQQEMAASFGVTLMTLRQAVAALEADGLVWAARGRGTFVVDRPVDITVSNLSSFAQQMRAAGVELSTEVLTVDVAVGEPADRASAALQVDGELVCVTRRRSTAGTPFALQRSYLDASAGVVDPGGSLRGESLYDAIEAATGWTIGEARESISAVGLAAGDAELLSAPAGAPALRSVRTSINQFGLPFLYDEVVLVGERASIAANRTSGGLSLDYGVD
ncbi:MAG: GntR family transcriptional regulator [Actinomycetota bacterium]